MYLGGFGFEMSHFVFLSLGVDGTGRAKSTKAERMPLPSLPRYLIIPPQEKKPRSDGSFCFSSHSERLYSVHTSEDLSSKFRPRHSPKKSQCVIGRPLR